MGHCKSICSLPQKQTSAVTHIKRRKENLLALCNLRIRYLGQLFRNSSGMIGDHRGICTVFGVLNYLSPSALILVTVESIERVCRPFVICAVQFREHLSEIQFIEIEQDLVISKGARIHPFQIVPGKGFIHSNRGL